MSIIGEDKYKTMVENALVGVFIISDDKFTYANRTLSMITGYSQEELLGMNPLDFVHKDDYERVARNMQKRLEDDEKATEYSFKGVTKDNEIKYARVLGTLVEIEGEKAIIGTLIDETEKSVINNELQYLVNYDSLTGLFNRYYFNLQFEHLLLQASRSESQLAIILFDIDNFKRINDSLGHKAGDEVLVQTAHLINKVLRESDSFYRIGGDEFVIVMEKIHTASEVEILARRIQQSLKTSIEVEDHSFHISLSMGIAIFPEHGESIASLQKSADIAMYKAKKDGKNCFNIFSHESSNSSKLLKLENEFYEGIERGELEIYLQPQIELTSEKLIGAEALVRWKHPTKGILAPALFLPLAQEMGLLYKLDLIMIEKTFKLLERYDKIGILDFTLSVNISNALFHHQRFFSIMQKFQQRYSYFTQYIKLELTEDILMVDNNRTIKMIKSLRLIGYKLAIDDFGTGYSSFSHLKKLPIDELKIDREFIKDITKNKKDRAIVETIVNLGHTLELTVLAEGAEDEEEIALLKDMKCDIVQGYYYSKPICVAEFEKNYLVKR
jgi:diguanylate cyclase (GGDEF)-like protein/PAS domain S-box-containing protein